MLLFLLSAALAVPPAVALADCRPLSEDPTIWACGPNGDVRLTERVESAPEATLAKITRSDGVVVRLVELPGDALYAATWTEGGKTRQVEGRGDRGRLEPALFEWAARGGPGGGPMKVGDRVLDLPLGCWLDRGTARCGDGSAATVTDPAHPTVGRTSLGEIPCTAGGRAATCRVDAFGPALLVTARNGDRELGCEAGHARGGGEACPGLIWDPAAVERVFPTPGTSGCRLAVGGIWACPGARIAGPRCEGPPALCSRIRADWASHPPGARVAEVFGETVAVAPGCDVVEKSGARVVACESGVLFAWGTRAMTPTPATPAPKPCKVLGLRARCVPLSSGTQAILEDIPGVVECRGEGCRMLGLP